MFQLREVISDSDTQPLDQDDQRLLHDESLPSEALNASVITNIPYNLHFESFN